MLSIPVFNTYNHYAMCPAGQFRVNFLGLTWLGLLLLCMIFYLCSYSDFFFFAVIIWVKNLSVNYTPVLKICEKLAVSLISIKFKAIYEHISE